MSASIWHVCGLMPEALLFVKLDLEIYEWASSKKWRNPPQTPLPLCRKRGFSLCRIRMSEDPLSDRLEHWTNGAVATRVAFNLANWKNTKMKATNFLFDNADQIFKASANGLLVAQMNIIKLIYYTYVYVHMQRVWLKPGVWDFLLT